MILSFLNGNMILNFEKSFNKMSIEMKLRTLMRKKVKVTISNNYMFTYNISQKCITKFMNNCYFNFIVKLWFIFTRNRS